MKLQSTANRFVVLILTLFIGSLSAFAQDAPLQGFDGYVNKALKDWDVPGVAIAVIKDDKIVFAKGYGVREIGKPEKANERTNDFRHRLVVEGVHRRDDGDAC